MNYRLTFLLWDEYPTMLATFGEKFILPLNNVSIFVISKLNIIMRFSFWVIYSVALFYMSMRPPIPQCFDFYSYVQLWDFSHVIHLCHVVDCNFHTNFRIILLMASKTFDSNFDINCITLTDNLMENWHHYLIESSNSWIQYISPLIIVFFDFFHHHFVIVSISISPMLILYLSNCVWKDYK